MKDHSAFSLSMQKQIARQNITLDSEVDLAFNELGVKTMLQRSGITKTRGYETITLVFLFVLLPFFKRNLTAFWGRGYLGNLIEAQKDTFYRFLNHERFNWRKLVALLAMKVIAKSDPVPFRDKTLICDDTLIEKYGKDMELVSYHFDHKSRRSILSNQCLQLGYHNGINFFPIDAAFNTSSRRPNEKLREIDKRTNGWRRRQEALGKKTTALIQMLDRAFRSGIDASFVLFDSWFAHDAVVSDILNIGYGVICRLKRGRVKYEYNGEKFTLKQLWQREVKKKTVRLDQRPQFRAACIDVRLPKTGNVRLVFVSDGKKQWHVFLSTDTELQASEILDYYARRWAIEVFFKDAKQMLGLGKEQSRTFDATVAAYSLVMIRYLLLVYILNKRRIHGPIGPLFRELADDQTLRVLTDALWARVKELMILSSDLLSDDIDHSDFLHFIDIIEDLIMGSSGKFSAKL